MTSNDSAPLAVVTGANSGVGYHTTRLLVDQGWKVVMVCRSEERGRDALDRIREEVGGPTPELELADLSRMDDVLDLSERLGNLDRIDALVNNAGLYRGELTRTEDGFETTMAVNHLAHMLLTLRLEEKLRAPGHRVVSVASEGHRSGRLRRTALSDILEGDLDDYGGVQAYGDSKLANVLFTRELDRRWNPSGTVALALHPGVLSSRIWENTSGFLSFLTRLLKPFMKDPELGGRVTARAVTDPELAEWSGAYLKKFDVVKPAGDARDDDLARELWDTSARLLAPWL